MGCRLDSRRCLDATDLTGTVTIDLYKGGVYQKTLGTADHTAGTFSWTIAADETLAQTTRSSSGKIGHFGRIERQLRHYEVAVRKDDLLGTWDETRRLLPGFRHRDVGFDGLARHDDHAGDLDDDGTDDLIGMWPSQGGVWIKYSSSEGWVRLSSTAVHITSGDMNGDGRDDLLGTWDGQGVFYRDSATGVWVQMASPASMIASGDLDNDGTDDLIGIWPGQGGVWVKYSSTGDGR